MNKKSDVKFILGIFLIMAVSFIALSFLGLYPVGLSIISGMLSFIMLRGNMVTAILGAVFVFALDSLVRLTFSFASGLEICFCALMINLAVRGRGKLLMVTMLGTLGILLGAAASVGIGEIANVEGFRISDVKALISAMNDQTALIFELAGLKEMYTASEALFLLSFFKMVTVPLSLIMGTVLWSYFSVWVLKKIMKIRKDDLCDGISDFIHIRADRMCFLMLVLSFVLYVFMAERNMVISAAAFCMFFILGAFFFVCGLSIVSFFTKKFTGRKKFVLIVLTITGILFMPLFIIILGIIDSFRDLRKMGKENDING